MYFPYIKKVGIILSALLTGLSCSVVASAAQPGRVRVAVAYFSHEATTFAPAKAGRDGFEPANLSGERLLNINEEMQGFVKVASEHSNVEIIPLRSFGQVKGGSSTGWITRDAFEYFTDRMVRDLRSAGTVDAVFLVLHGAAAVEGIARPEAELARRVRAAVGRKVPIAATFDPHGNQSDAFLRYADFSLANKYYPHYDARLQGERAARLLLRAAAGDYVATRATRRPGIVTPTVFQWTGKEPWMSLVQRALTWEAREKDVFVSLFFGYPWSDTPDVGATIQVMTNNDQPLADRIAEDLNNYIVKRREEIFRTPVVKPREAVRLAKEAALQGRVPAVLADYSDRGGDATHLLSEVLKQDLNKVIIATLRDEHVIRTLTATGAKAGDLFDRSVGGFAIPEASGKPVRVRGRLVYFGSVNAQLGDAPSTAPVAVVEFGRGNLLIITGYLVQVMEPEHMRFGPIRPETFNTWIVKSRVHFRRGFDDTGFAKTIILADAPGPFLGTIHLEALPYRNFDLRSAYPYRDISAPLPTSARGSKAVTRKESLPK